MLVFICLVKHTLASTDSARKIIDSSERTSGWISLFTPTKHLRLRAQLGCNDILHQLTAIGCLTLCSIIIGTEGFEVSLNLVSAIWSVKILEVKN